MKTAAAIEEWTVLGEQAHAVVPEGLDRERALASAWRKENRDRPLPTRDAERMQAREVQRVEMLADPPEQEVVDGIVRDLFVQARELHPVAFPVDDGDSSPDVVDDRLRAGAIDGVPRRDERRREISEDVEIDRPALDQDLDGAAPCRLVGREPRIVEPHGLQHLGPIALDRDRQT